MLHLLQYAFFIDLHQAFLTITGAQLIKRLKYETLTVKRARGNKAWMFCQETNGLYAVGEGG